MSHKSRALPLEMEKKINVKTKTKSSVNGYDGYGNRDSDVGDNEMQKPTTTRAKINDKIVRSITKKKTKEKIPLMPICMKNNCNVWPVKMVALIGHNKTFFIVSHCLMYFTCQSYIIKIASKT